MPTELYRSTQDDSPQRLGFVDLPTEIVEKVARWMQATDIISLRLVCRSIESKLLHHFGAKYLYSIKTDLSEGSLENLQALSRHRELCIHIKIIRVTTPEKTLTIPQVQVLKSILKDMVNCGTFDFERTSETRQDDCLNASDMLALISYIISDPGISVKALRIKFPLGSYRPRVRYFRLPIETTTSPSQTTLPQLEHLCLEPLHYEEHAEWAANLIKSAQNLKRLHLHNLHDRYFALDRRLASLDPAPRIENLDLWCKFARFDTTTQLLRNLRSSLRRLSFRTYRIDVGGTMLSLLTFVKEELPLLESIELDAVRDAGSAREQWIHSKWVTFPGMKGNPEVEGADGRTIRNTRMKEKKDEMRVVGIRYEGPKMDVALDMIIGSTEAI